MNLDTIIYQKKDHLVRIILNRPKRGNAIDIRLAQELGKAVDMAEKDGEVKGIIFSGKGKGFCAGADISDLDFNSIETVEAFLKKIHLLFNKIENIEKPTIAAINGYAVGGGCELALVCDLRIGSEAATIGVPEINMGFLPGAGATQRLPRLIGTSNALEMLFTGDSFDAHEAYRVGLFNKVVKHEKLMDEVLILAEKVIGKSPLALKMAKKLVKNGIKMDLESALKYEIKVVSDLSFKAISERKGGFA